MQIRCDYCGNYIDDTMPICPHCGGINDDLKRVGNGVPQTIEELKQWYIARNLPPEETTRFFIGKDYKKPRAFGIYYDDYTGNFVVYKNKDNGTRAIRYEGKDEAYAVNELYLKLKEEVSNQKRNNKKGNNNYSNYSNYSNYINHNNYNYGGNKKSRFVTKLIAMLSPCIIPLLLCIFGLCGSTISNVNDTEDKFYKYENNYYYCDENRNWFVIEDKMQSIKKPKFLELTKFEEMYGLDYSCNSYFYINNQLYRYNGENNKWACYKQRQKEWKTINVNKETLQAYENISYDEFVRIWSIYCYNFDDEVFFIDNDITYVYDNVEKNFVETSNIYDTPQFIDAMLEDEEKYQINLEDGYYICNDVLYDYLYLPKWKIYDENLNGGSWVDATTIDKELIINAKEHYLLDPQTGYYRFDDKTFYYYKSDWYYDNNGVWEETSPNKLIEVSNKYYDFYKDNIDDKNSNDDMYYSHYYNIYDYSSSYDSSYDYSDFEDSSYYDAPTYDYDNDWDSDWDSDYDWDSGSSWDSGYSDWGSDW